jgi:hypothetical protein
MKLPARTKKTNFRFGINPGTVQRISRPLTAAASARPHEAVRGSFWRPSVALIV